MKWLQNSGALGFKVSIQALIQRFLHVFLTGITENTIEEESIQVSNTYLKSWAWK